MPDAKAPVTSLNILPAGIEFDCAIGETVMDAATRQGIEWPSVCHGQAQCLSCAAEVQTGGELLGLPDTVEAERIGELRQRGLRPRDWRLACRATRVAGGAIVLTKRGVRPSR